jgi:HK97 family phage major capsid protein
MIAEAGQLAERASAIAEGEKRGNELAESFRSATGHEARGGEKRPSSGLGEWARSARVGDGFDLAPVAGAERRALLGVRGTESRALSATGGVGTDGVYGQLWEYAIASSQLLQAGVDIINTTDGNSLPFPRATVHSTTSDTPVAASGTLGTSDATIDTVALTVSKYAYITLVPSELVQDVTFDLEGYLAKSAGRELGRRVAKIASAAQVSGFTTAGSTGPTGTATSLGNQSTVGQGSDLLIDLFHSVLPEYRTDAAWTMADPTAAVVRKLKTSTGDPVWQPALTAGDPDMVLGKPVYIDPFLPSPAASAKSVYFGEYSALKVRIAGGLRFERSADYAFGNDQIAYRAIVRAGAAAIDPNAVKYFVHSAT